MQTVEKFFNEAGNLQKIPEYKLEFLKSPETLFRVNIPVVY